MAPGAQRSYLVELLVRGKNRPASSRIFEGISMYRKILVSTDGTELSIRAVKEAARLASAVGAKLLVLHVRSPLEIPHHVTGGAWSSLGEEKITEEIKIEEQELLRAASEAATSVGVVPEVAFIARFYPHQGITQVAQEQDCDLIVMGTRIREGIPGYFVKSETRKVLKQTTTPVLVVR
jgi:nucleotide-binding universal stress UspA family protein